MSGLRLQTQTFLHLWINFLQQIFTVKVWTGGFVGEGATLFGACLMDGAALVQLAVGEKDAGAVVAYLEGVAIFNVLFAHLTVGDTEMPGDTVDIGCGDEKARSRQTVAAYSGAKVAKSSITFCLR